jgi:hypothetical protein
MRDMKRGGKAMGMVLLAAVLAGGRVLAAVSSGLLLTNFTSATYSLPSGSGVDGTDTGVSCINIPNGASAWVLVTDSPQLCLRLWKTAIQDGNGTPFAGPYPVVIGGKMPGEMICFQIGFSNCGGFTGFSVTITDLLPTNVVKAQSLPGSFWVSGGYGSILTPWASSLAGPWAGGTNAGQMAPLYMRWLIGRVGMGKSGYVRYCVTIL